tara:strand:- start:2754 stop:2939 length:186 start_codon:yes stop_codon:yes gene_type:complete
MAISGGKKISITGVSIVPKPNPEKKVRSAAKNATIAIIKISIFNLKFFYNIIFIYIYLKLF